MKNANDENYIDKIYNDSRNDDDNLNGHVSVVQVILKTITIAMAMTLYVKWNTDV